MGVPSLVSASASAVYRVPDPAVPEPVVTPAATTPPLRELLVSVAALVP